MEHKRMILIPKDKEAKERLDYGLEREDDLIEFYLSEKDYNILDKEGVFKLINLIADTWIDEYEEDDLAGKENLYKVMEALEKLPNKSLLANKVLELVKEAHGRDTGIYFYF